MSKPKTKTLKLLGLEHKGTIIGTKRKCTCRIFLVMTLTIILNIPLVNLKEGKNAKEDWKEKIGEVKSRLHTLQGPIL